MDDKAIVDLYWARSERAISETDAKYGKYCRKISFNILADSADAEECVNDTYLKAWNTMPSNRPTSLIHYVGKMTRWISLTRLREKNSLRHGGGEMPLVLQLEIKELSLAFRRLLDQLPKDERDVFLCRYWYVAPISEIAKQFDFSESKVKTMLFRTRKKLLNQLKEEGLC